MRNKTNINDENETLEPIGGSLALLTTDGGSLPYCAGSSVVDLAKATSLEDLKSQLEELIERCLDDSESITDYIKDFPRFGDNIHRFCTSKRTSGALGKVLSWDGEWMLFETWDTMSDGSGVIRNQDGSVTPGDPGIRKLVLLPNSAVQMIQECTCCTYCLQNGTPLSERESIITLEKNKHGENLVRDCPFCVLTKVQMYRLHIPENLSGKKGGECGLKFGCYECIEMHRTWEDESY